MNLSMVQLICNHNNSCYMLLCVHTFYVGRYLSCSKFRLQCGTCMNTLCVAASSNAALLRPAYQSSVWYYDVANKAVDGIANMNYHAGSCSVTDPCYHCRPWWAVDLGTAMSVVAVIIANRNDDIKYSRLCYTKQKHSACCFIVVSNNN